MYKISSVAKTRFFNTWVAKRLVSSRASSTVENGLREELLRNSDSQRSVPELRFTSKRLIRSNRYDRKLQMIEWNETQNHDARLTSYDHHALKLELIIKNHGLKDAEEYFEQLLHISSSSTSSSPKAAKSAYLPLLRAYVMRNLVQEAETLMEKLNELGFLVTPHPFNEMMKLYESTHQYEKVPLVISLMKSNKIPRNVLSYNLWMNSCFELSGVAGVETVYKEMVSDKSVEIGWSSLCTLANVYVKAGFGFEDKANLVLEKAEKTLNRSNRLGYFFLITLYASLRNKEGILRLWEASKSVCGRITCANYICVLSSLVKIGNLGEAERVFSEWEAECCNYDVRVANVLLGGYARNGEMCKAEALHARVLKKGGNPNYKTWEILMEGYVKCRDMAKAVVAMRQSFELMKGCHWRPSENIVMAIAEYFEKEERTDEANRYVRDLRRLGLVVSLPIYKVLLRMHKHAQRPAFEIYEMMKSDNIRID